MLPALRSRLWNPVRRVESPFDAIWGDMDRWLGRFLSDTQSLDMRPEPRLEVEEDENEVRVRAEIPGVKREDLHVDFHDGILTLRGEKKDEHEGKGGGRHWSERSYGSFVRSVSVPDHVDAEKIAAAYKDGILTLNMPKTEEAKPKQIEVKSA